VAARRASPPTPPTTDAGKRLGARSEPEASVVSIPPERRAAIRGALLAWYQRAHRDLPWRRTSDPYRVWISEIMLQQTRVETVIPYYERFLARFPDVSSLADAPEQDVLREWAGLGYYARARNMKRAAELVVRDHGGVLPRERDALAALPGIGRYTLGAVRSIAFGEPEPLVDGNVERVFARLCATPAPSARACWELAAALVPGERPDQWNQALMELGATVCTPRKPSCGSCPLADECAARRTADPEAFPAPRKRAAVREVRELAGALERGGRKPAILMLQRPSRGLLGGLWELPSVESTQPAELVAAVRERTGLRVRAGLPLGTVLHGFTHRSLTLALVRLELEPRQAGRLEVPDARWCGADDLEELPLSRLTRKALALARS
jgi:A/G-specific adenine glycosylase